VDILIKWTGHDDAKAMISGVRAANHHPLWFWSNASILMENPNVKKELDNRELQFIEYK
jgi:hypothetical protein